MKRNRDWRNENMLKKEEQEVNNIRMSWQEEIEPIRIVSSFFFCFPLQGFWLTILFPQLWDEASAASSSSLPPPPLSPSPISQLSGEKEVLTKYPMKERLRFLHFLNTCCWMDVFLRKNAGSLVFSERLTEEEAAAAHSGKDSSRSTDSFQHFNPTASPFSHKHNNNNNTLQRLPPFSFLSREMNFLGGMTPTFFFCVAMLLNRSARQVRSDSLRRGCTLNRRTHTCQATANEQLPLSDVQNYKRQVRWGLDLEHSNIDDL